MEEERREGEEGVKGREGREGEGLKPPQNKFSGYVAAHGYVPLYAVWTQYCTNSQRYIWRYQQTDYRAISLSTVISKVFETSVIKKCENYLYSHDLQFGSKKHTGCANDVYAIQQVVNTERGSTVYVQLNLLN